MPDLDIRSTYSDHIKGDTEKQCNKKKEARSKSLDFATIPDKVDPSKFKNTLLHAKIPSDRFFDSKTRTIINLPN